MKFTLTLNSHNVDGSRDEVPQEHVLDGPFAIDEATSFLANAVELMVTNQAQGEVREINFTVKSEVVDIDEVDVDLDTYPVCGMSPPDPSCPQARRN